MPRKLLFLSIIALMSLHLKAQYTSGWDNAINFGGAGTQINDLQFTANGDLYLVATLMGKYQFAGVNYDAGNQSSYPAYDIIYGKITSGGTQVLLKRVSSIFMESLVNGLRLAPDGSLFVFRTGTGLTKDFGNGITSPAYGLQLIKYSNTGSTEWLKKLPSFTDAEFGSIIAPVPGINGLQINNDGSIYTIVQSYYPRGSLYPTRILKLNGTGDEIWHYEVTTDASASNINFNYNPKQFADNEGNVTFLAISSHTGVKFDGLSLPYEEPYAAAYKNWIVSLDANGHKKWNYTAYIFPTFYGVNPQTGDIYLNYTYQKSPAAPAVQSPFSSLPNLAPPPAFSYLPTVYAWSGIITFNKAGSMVKTKANYYPNHINYPPQLQISNNGRFLLYGKYTADAIVAAGNNFLVVNGSESAAMEVDADFNPISVYKLPGSDAMAVKDNQFTVGGRFKTPLTIGSSTLTPYYIDTDFDSRFPAWVSIKTDIFIGTGNLDNIPLDLSSSTWLGANTNWNDAANWTNGIPTAETKVIFSNATSVMPTVATTPKAGKVIINAGEDVKLPATLAVTDIIENNGKLTITSTGSLSFSGFGASEITGTGELFFTGAGISYLFAKPTTNSVSFNNNFNISATVSKLKFSGSTAKLIGNPTVTSADEDAVSGYSANAYIIGKLTRAIQPTATYYFPVGNYSEYAPVQLELNEINGTSFVTVEAKDASAGTPNLNLAGSVVNKTLGTGYWILSSDVAPSSGTYKVIGEKNTYTNGVVDANRYILLKRSTGNPWAFEGTNELSTQTGGTTSGSVVSNGQAKATLNNLSAFSDLVIGTGSIAINPGLVISASTWTGGADKVWNNAANWSNGIPNGTINAIIPAGLSNYPEIYNESADNARSLTVESGAAMKLNAQLKLTNGLINNGTVELFSNTASATFTVFGGGISGTGQIDIKSTSNIIVVAAGNINNYVRVDIGNANTISLAGNYEGGLNVISGKVNTTGLSQTNPLAILQITDRINHIAGPVTRLLKSEGYVDFLIGNSSGSSSTRTFGSVYIANYTQRDISYTASFNSNSTTAVSITNGADVINSFVNSGQWTVTPSIVATEGFVNLTFRTSDFTNGRTNTNDYVLLRKEEGSSTKWVVTPATIVEHTGLITATLSGAAALTGATKFCIGLKAVTTTWTGSLSDDWNTIGNWSNGKPSATIKAIFNNSATIFPATNVPSSGTGAAAIEVQANTTISLPAGFYSPMGIINNGAIEIKGTGEYRGFGTSTYSELSGTGKLIFGNNSPGIIESYYTSTTINNSIEINRIGGVTITRTTNIGGSLSLVNGLVTIASGNMLVLTNPNATTTGSANSYVYGELKRTVNSSGNYTFPVGNATTFAPAAISLNSITGPQSITAKFTSDAISGAPNVTVGNKTITELLSAGSWTISPNIALTGGTYDISLSGPLGSAAGSDYVVLKRPSNLSFYPWEQQGNPEPASTVDGTVTAVSKGLTSFSQFGIGVVQAVLPITLSEFSVTAQANTALLNWATLSESNNAKFIIERSKNGEVFESIGERKGKGNSDRRESYSFKDMAPLAGVNYYRLKQIDFDGRYSYSEVRSVVFSNTLVGITMYPNPVSTILHLTGLPATPCVANLYNTVGNLVYTVDINGNKLMVPNHLANGSYIIHITSEGQVLSRDRIIIKK